MPRSKRLRSLERKGLLAEAKATLKDLPMEQLLNLRFEVGRQLDQQSTMANDLRTRLDAIRAEISARDETWDGYRITDHAVVRYLERHKGVNIADVRREIAEMVKASKGIEIRGPHRGVIRDEGTGLTLGVDPRDGSPAVTTVYFDRELPVLKMPGDDTVP